VLLEVKVLMQGKVRAETFVLKTQIFTCLEIWGEKNEDFEDQGRIREFHLHLLRENQFL